MKYVICNFKKVLSIADTKQVLDDYSKTFTADRLFFCVIPSACELSSKFKLFSQNDDTCGRMLLGHSDARIAFRLQDKDILDKVKYNLKIGAEVILCVGESIEDKQANKTKKILKDQLAGLKKFSKYKLIIVYEPIYAIGKSQLPELGEVCEAMRFIKKLLPSSPILYGGGVNDSNIQVLLEKQEVDGVFLHSIALNKQKLLKIVQCAKKY